MLDSAGIPHVADFGLAAAVVDLHIGDAGAGGTIAYMSPEQATAFRSGMTPASVDTRSDVWALGVILYELLTGRKPFARPEDKRDEILEALCRDEPQRIQDLCPEVPADLERLVGECLKKNVAERMQSANEMAERLRRWLDSVSAIPAPLDFSASLQEARQEFVDRPWLFDEVNAWPVHRNERLLLLTGELGSGKSAFLAELIHRNPEDRIVAWHLCRHDWPDSRSPAKFVRSLAGMLATRLEGYRTQLADLSVRETLRMERCELDPASAFETAIVTPLAKASPPDKGVWFVVVDALDEADCSQEPTIAQLLAQWEKRIPEWLRIVASTRRNALEPDLFEGLRGLVLDRDSDSPNQDVRGDLERFLRERLAQPNFSERLVQANVSLDTVVVQLLEKSELNFLYVKVALEGIEKGELSFLELDQLPRGLQSLFAEFFKRQWNRESYKKVRPLLEIFVASKEPVSEELLRESLDLDPYELDGILVELAQYLHTRHDTFGLRLQALREWLITTRGPFRIHLQEGEKQLADFCWKQYEGNTNSLSRYVLRHLVAHLTAVPQQEECLSKALTDLAFLEMKAEEGFVVDLSSDFDQALDYISVDNSDDVDQIRLLRLALRLDLSFISAHPETLFQCLFNRCWWHERQTPSDDANHPIHGLMQLWLEQRGKMGISHPWVRSLRPPTQSLTGPIHSNLRGHVDSIVAVAVSRDGNRVATASDDNTIRVWDVPTGAVFAIFPVELTPNQQRIWINQANGEPHTIPPDHWSALALCFSRDGKFLASGHRDWTVRLWNIETKTQERCLRGHDGDVMSLSFSPDGKILASGGDDQTVRIWDPEQDTLLRTLGTPTTMVYSLAFSPEGAQLAAASSVGKISIWNTATWSIERDINTESFSEGERLRAIAYLPGGGSLAIATDQTISIWDLHSNRIQHHFREPSHVWLQALAIGEEGQVASAGNDRVVRIRDINELDKVQELRGHSGPVRGLAFGGKWLVSVSDDRTGIVWNPSLCTGLAQPQLDEQLTGIFDTHFLPGESQFASTGYSAVRLWNTETGCLTGALEDPDSERWVPKRIATCPSKCSLLASGDQYGIVRVWRLHTTNANIPIWISKEEMRSIHSLVFSPDGELLAAGGDTKACVWNSTSGQLVSTFCRHKHYPFGTEEPVLGLAFSADGSLVASCSKDRTVRLWDVQSGEPLALCSITTNLCARFLPAWKEGENWDHVYVAGNWFLSVAISSDGKWLAAGTGSGGTFDNLVVLWNLEDLLAGNRIRPRCLRGHGNGVDSLLFSSDGKLLASGSEDETVRIWDVASGECRGILGSRKPDDSMFDARCSPGWQRWVETGNTQLNGPNDETLWVQGVPHLLRNLNDTRIWAGPERLGTHITLYRVVTSDPD